MQVVFSHRPSCFVFLVPLNLFHVSCFGEFLLKCRVVCFYGVTQPIARMYTTLGASEAPGSEVQLFEVFAVQHRLHDGPQGRFLFFSSTSRFKLNSVHEQKDCN